MFGECDLRCVLQHTTHLRLDVYLTQYTLQNTSDEAELQFIAHCLVVIDFVSTMKHSNKTFVKWTKNIPPQRFV